MNTLTPKMAAIEERFGKSVRDVLIELLDEKTVAETADILGVSPALVNQWMREFRIRRKMRVVNGPAS